MIGNDANLCQQKSFQFGETELEIVDQFNTSLLLRIVVDLLTGMWKPLSKQLLGHLGSWRNLFFQTNCCPLTQTHRTGHPSVWLWHLDYKTYINSEVRLSQSLFESNFWHYMLWQMKDRIHPHKFGLKELVEEVVMLKHLWWLGHTELTRDKNAGSIAFSVGYQQSDLKLLALHGVMQVVLER